MRNNRLKNLCVNDSPKKRQRLFPSFGRVRGGGVRGGRWNQLSLFLLIVGINMILIHYLAWGTAHLLWQSISLDNPASNLENPAIVRYINTVTSIVVFGFSSLLYAFIVNNGKPFSYLKMDKGFKWNRLLLLLLIFCASLPALSWIIKWNEGLHLPQTLSAIEQWMREQEETSTVLTKQMLSGTSLSVLFANLLAMAIVPAVCEELFFRGALLSWLKNSFGKKHLAVWLSAIIFSAIHVQFFGFLPRMLLGAYFGYLFLWTGSLWTAIVAHFLNNAVIVVTAFLYNTGYITTDYEQIGNGGEKVWAIFLSFGITTILMGKLWKDRV